MRITSDQIGSDEQIWSENALDKAAMRQRFLRLRAAPYTNGAHDGA
jgi:hypothetical protein